MGYNLFDAAMLIQGASGAQLYIYTESGEIGNFLQEFADNRWTEDNTSTSTYPRTFNRGEEYWQANANTWWLQKTDYIRLKSLEVGFNLPVQYQQENRYCWTSGLYQRNKPVNLEYIEDI